VCLGQPVTDCLDGGFVPRSKVMDEK